MNARMQAAVLPGGRLHLNDGPIDLVIGADGPPDHVRAAYRGAVERFSSILDELCDELAVLREAMHENSVRPNSPTARRMDAAVRPLCADRFLTRMAAVAGAVADEILASICAAAPLSRAYVNNGGDIALHLAEGESFSVAMVDRPDRPRLFATAHIRSSQNVRGIATSGARGRSLSLGIADAVTILASDAAAADAAATLVANAVDLRDHPGITRVRACDIDPQSDLGERPVTQAVGPLTFPEIERALAAGLSEAQRLLATNAIRAAALHLAGVTRIVSEPGLSDLTEITGCRQKGSNADASG
jgi:ApbE superfamily uncharacterized protein (UPF0280 family)